MNEALTGAEVDTLVALVERGPVWDGEVPSKTARDSLVARGFAARIVFLMEDGHTAATYAGRDAYKAHFGTSLGGVADTIAEARANRIARRAMRGLKHTKD